MTKFFRDNSKKLLAIFGVILMIAFVLPVGMKSGGFGSQRQLVGRLAGDRKVYSTDLSHAKSQWSLLEHYIVIPLQATRGQPVSIVQALAQSQEPETRTLVEEVQAHPETFFLLQREADNMGIRITPQQAEQEFGPGGLNVRLPSGVVTDLAHVPDPQLREAILDAYSALVRVQLAMTRATNVVKVSQPRARNELAGQMVRMKVRFAALAAGDFLAKVPAPTRQQLQEQFEKFAGYQPDTPPTPDNPHGFAYKYPNRAAVQYIGITRDEVRKVVLAAKSDYDWEVEAQQYYIRHPGEFQATPTTSPSTAPAAATPPPGPTTRPFAEVKEQIIEKLTTPEIARKSRDAQDRILSKLTADYAAYQATHPTTAPSAATAPAAGGGAPASSGGAPPSDFTSYEYLKRLAADVQKQTGILPTIGQIAALTNSTDLAKEPGIGQSAQANGMPFAVYATHLAAATLPPAEQNNPDLLQLFQPSKILRTPSQSSYVFRLTDAHPAEKPQSLDEVAAKVEADWKLAQAYALAKQQAESVAAAARSDALASAEPAGSPAAQSSATQPATGPTATGPTTSPSDANAAPALAAAAKAAGLGSAVTEWFNRMGPPTIANLPLEPSDTATFRTQAAQLLSRAATQPTPPPVGVIEIPVAHKVFVAQLVSAEPAWDTKTLPIFEYQIEEMMKRDESLSLRARWYTFNAVAARTGWQDDTASARPSRGNGNQPSIPAEPPLGG